MDFEDFNAQLAGLVEVESEQGAEPAAAACDALRERAQLDEVQGSILRYLRGQFLIGAPARHAEAAEGMREALVVLRKAWPPFHEDRAMTESIARQVFGPRGKLNPPPVAARWADYVQAAELNNQNDHAGARDLLLPLANDPDPALRGSVRAALLTICANLGEGEVAIEHGRAAADAVAELPAGHWARIQVEAEVLQRVVNAGAGIDDDALNQRIAAGIQAINAQESSALGAWDEALSEVSAAVDAEARGHLERMDRLLKGLAGPLALLVAFANMQAAQAGGDMEATLDATEAAYYLAREKGAERTASELRPLLEASDRRLR